jgi:hypothetical protein
MHYSIITIVNNKISEVFNFLNLSYIDYDSCEYFEFDHTKYGFSNDNGKQFGDVLITLKRIRVKNGDRTEGLENCGGKKITTIKKYKAHLIWNDKKKIYEDELKNFDRLNKQSSAHLLTK